MVFMWKICFKLIPFNLIWVNLLYLICYRSWNIFWTAFFKIRFVSSVTTVFKKQLLLRDLQKKSNFCANFCIKKQLLTNCFDILGKPALWLDNAILKMMVYKLRKARQKVLCKKVTLQNLPKLRGKYLR